MAYEFDRIDLNTLLLVLQEFRYVGQVRGTLQTGANIAGPAQVTLVLTDGKLVESRLVASDGTQFTGEDALRLAHAYTPSAWQLLPDHRGHPQTSSFSPPKASSSRRAPVPPPGGEWSLLQPSSIAHRVDSVDEQILQTWETRQRMVYRLINGQRSMEIIRRLVSLSPEAMERAIAALLAKQVITLS